MADVQNLTPPHRSKTFFIRDNQDEINIEMRKKRKLTSDGVLRAPLEVEKK
ncbi:hypothetical protein KPH14_002593, partial [Odynerus spinipes]